MWEEREQGQREISSGPDQKKIHTEDDNWKGRFFVLDQRLRKELKKREDSFDVFVQWAVSAGCSRPDLRCFMSLLNQSQRGSRS
jgi:predicted sulfurtransferase